MTNEMKEILDTIQESYKQGYKDAIEKAVKWLEENFEVEKYDDWIDVDGRPLFNYQRFEDDFKKAMEEQQCQNIIMT